MDITRLDQLERLDIPGRLFFLASVLGDKTAVQSKSDSLTFRQLEESSNRIAQALAGLLGHTKQIPIAVLLESSTAIIASIYGSLRAGHFYCVVSPAEPLEHIAKVLGDLGESVLVTEAHILDRVQEILPKECRVLLYSHIEERADDGNWPVIDPASLAGIFYTSGSTGIPKGVMRAHRDILYMIRNFGRRLGFRPEDHILAMRPFGSVSSAVDVFGGLMNGASLVTYDFKAGGAADLVAVLKSEKITIFRPAVQVMRSFVDLLPEGEYFPDIRLFFATGDVLYKKDVERIRKLIPRESVVIHQLASSEAGLLTVNKISFDMALEDGIISVGHPLPEQEILILDDEGGIITDQRLGEIGVRGDFVFPGYWRHPEWTAEMFIPDPRDPRKQIYRTGDLGRVRPDGQLEFAGRNDRRVKIKGYSVDLTAIDLAIQKFKGVSRSVTVAQANQSGAKRLVAYIQPVAGVVLSPSDLRKNLLRVLPDYMVPYLFVPIDDIPLTFAGKVDRKALPLPDWKQSQSSVEYVAPRNANEEKLALLWQKVFEVEKIGVNDNFFDLGGDSLLASALFVEIELAFGKRFPLSLLLRHGTVASLAEIARTQDASNLDHLVTMRAEGKNPPLFLIPGGGSDTITFIELVDALGKDQPVYGLEDPFVGTSRSIYADGIRPAAKEFIKIMRSAQPKGPYYLGGHSFGGVIAFEIACQLKTNGEQVGFLGILDANAPVKTKRAGTLSNRLQTHKSNLAGRSVGETIQYLAKRAQRRFSKLGKNRWAQKIYKIKWIENLLWSDNRRYVQMARGGYDPGVYEGDAIVYRASERPLSVTWDMTEAWKDFILGTLEYYDVPGPHNYIIKHPHVEHLARLMTGHLERAFDLRRNMEAQP